MWYFSSPARIRSNASSTVSANCSSLNSSSLIVPQRTMALQFSTSSQYLRPYMRIRLCFASLRVCKLFVGKLNRKTDGFAAGFVSPTIGRFHDAGAAAGTDDKTPRSWAEGKRPGCNLMRELARFFVIAGHLQQALGVTHGCAV